MAVCSLLYGCCHTDGNQWIKDAANMNQALIQLRQQLEQISVLPDIEYEFLKKHARSHVYEPHEHLLHSGTQAEFFWFKLTGFCRFYYLAESGRELNKAFSRPGEIVVPLSSVVSGEVSDYAISAVTQVKTLRFPVELINTLYQRHPAWERIGRVLAEQMAIRKEKRERELLLDSTLTRYQRFAQTYPELVDKVAQKQIANYIGITEQALSRVLKEFLKQS